MKPHKHAEIIKAWADGAQIQIKTWTDDIRNTNETSKLEWVDNPNPSWNPIFKYRIKPKEKVVRWLWIYKNAQRRTGWFIFQEYLTESEADKVFEGNDYKKLEWSREEFDE